MKADNGFTYINWAQATGMCHVLIREITLANWRPEYVVGLTRGGLAPGVMLSHYYEVPFKSLHVSFIDAPEEQESMKELTKLFLKNKKVLIVDDINDTGRTINHIKDNVWFDADEHFDLFGYKDEEEFLKQKKYDLRFAVLVHNEASDADVNYSAKHINKMENPEWVVFPWENWWEALPK